MSVEGKQVDGLITQCNDYSISKISISQEGNCSKSYIEQYNSFQLVA